MSKIQSLRGMPDLYGEKAELFRQIDQRTFQMAQNYGYTEMSTPIVEFTDVFKRSLGDTTDVVSKEMYTFEDRGGDSVTLRPEGTAGIARAFISEGLAQNLPLRLYYSGPMFRYERPQKGRQRQFHQLGVEFLGEAAPAGDIETLSLAANVLKALGLSEKTQLELNTIGDLESRQAYRQALIDYLEPYKNDLSKDSQTRLTQNPLRVLDSKDENDQKITEEAPKFADSLNDESKAFFNSVREGLEALSINYELNQRLVRGLDYYCHTVFEFTTTALGAQNAVLSGGRYDGLIEQMGGKSTPGVGWAAGLERLAMLVEDSWDLQKDQPMVLIPLGEAAQKKAYALAHELRAQGHLAHQIYSGTNMGKLMKKANKLNASHALILGDDEIAQDKVTIKEFATGEQKTMAWGDFLASLGR